MSDEEKTKKIDDVLEVLAKPLSRYVLSVLAGVDPGNFTDTLEDYGNNDQEKRSNEYTMD